MKNPVILFLAVLVLSGPALNLVGVCINKDDKQPVRTDDAAIIDAAIEMLLAKHRLSGWEEVIEKSEDSDLVYWSRRYINYDEYHDLYKDLAEFRRINPDCCSITQKGKKRFTPSFYQRISGKAVKFVRIKYRGMDRLPDGTRKPFKMLRFFAVSNCGALDNDYI